MSEFISGWELLGHWKIKKFELYRYIKNGNLRPYDQFGRLKPYIGYVSKKKREDLEKKLEYHQQAIEESEIRSKKSSHEKPSWGDFFNGIIKVSSNSEIRKIESQLSRCKGMPLDPYDWSRVQIPSGQDAANKFLAEICNCLYHKREIQSTINQLQIPSKPNNQNQSKRKEKAKLRPSQRRRLACRKVAAGIWEIHPEITIADMIVRDEITEACEGKIYAERTIRNWVNDLCPDRSPGRRRKKSDPN